MDLTPLLARLIKFMRMFMQVVMILGMMMFGMQVFWLIAAVLVTLIRLSRLGRIAAPVLHDLALNPLAITAAARIAMARPAAIGAVFGLLFGLAVGAFVRLDQRLTIGNRDLIVIGVDFAEGQKAVTVAAIFDEGSLERRLYARDLGEIDVAAELLALCGLEIKLFDAIAADHNDPGLLRMGGIDQHFVGHFETLDGGGRV
jgi:hypothetical protein